LEAAGIPILGTSPDAIDLAEDRERFQALLNDLGLKQPVNGIASTEEQALEIAGEVGFPLVIRPSYVLGGRGMEIVRDMDHLWRYIREAVVVSGDSPVLLDSYLVGAVEVDVDALCDGENVHVAGVMEHIEEAGVHSGDSACSLPPHSLSAQMVAELKSQSVALAKALGVVGLMNVQFAIKGDDIYLIEVNPRASRTVPFVAKAIGSPIAAIAARLMAGERLDGFELKSPDTPHIAVKEAVLPFARFPGVDTLLGPEMRSTGEVMGLDTTFERAFLKAQMGAGVDLPKSGAVFISIKNADKGATMLEAAQTLHDLGFEVLATSGTASWLTEQGIPARRIPKVYEEQRPNIIDEMKNGAVQIIFNTTEGAKAIEDSRSMRAVALYDKVPYYTTAAGARAAALAIRNAREGELGVMALQAM
ncbi:MAG: ATP-grasp domain-containing protein, partial [Pseudomonadota bacterium]